jgi:hypothetical protein
VQDRSRHKLAAGRISYGGRITILEHRHGALGWALALGTGLILWSAASYLAGGGEPWDSGTYWTGAYPLAVIMAAALGFAFPERSWRWALGIMLAQLPVMLATESGFGLLPLGLVLLGVLSLPAILTAKLGAWLRRWMDR